VAADAPHVYAIERFISQKIRRARLEGFDYQYTALFEQEKAGQRGSYPGKVRGARIRGGYFFGPARRR
jgi:ATP-dependent RNA helicase RhlE